MTGSCVALRISPTRKTNSIPTRISGSSSPARVDTSSTLSSVSVSSPRYKSAPISGLYCASRRRQVRASGLQEAEVFLRAQARRLPREQILRQPGLFQDLLHAEAHSGEIVPVSSADQKICHVKPSFWPLSYLKTVRAASRLAASAECPEGPVEHAVAEEPVGPDHRLCAEPDQIARAGPALGDGLADRFCDQRWLGEQVDVFFRFSAAIRPQSVLIPPGSTTTTSMPNGCSSSRRQSDRPSTAYFVA